MSEYMDSLLHDESSFVVTDDQKALWCIKKIAEAEEEAKTLLDHYATQADAVRKSLDDTRQRMNALLLPYFQGVPRKITKTQESYVLPGATLMLKHQAPEYKRDADRLLAYLRRSAPEYVKVVTVTTETPQWGEFKKRTAVSGTDVIDTETGEVVEGVTVTEQPDKFEVKIDGI